jgi:hypothetical protein
LLSLLNVGESQEHICISNGEFCSDFVYLTLACAMAFGEEIKISSGWTTDAAVKVEAEAETWCS